MAPQGSLRLPVKGKIFRLEKNEIENERQRSKTIKALTCNVYKRLENSRDNGISEGSQSEAATVAAVTSTAVASRARARAIAIVAITAEGEAVAEAEAEAEAVASSAVAALKNPGKKILRACAKFGRPAAGPRRTASYGGPPQGPRAMAAPSWYQILTVTFTTSQSKHFSFLFYYRSSIECVVYVGKIVFFFRIKTKEETREEIPNRGAFSSGKINTVS
ncbi:hypothetical protein V1477_014463 [Vespula maculifrons]|uniref:Uncharacterized protein n=1 Tax=Vespula maculifrons TaxID=7453 RepID=A0ABD2BLK9_VESMC